MPRDITKKKDCHDCGAKPGSFHKPGCDTERCRLCGGQMISCNCIYGVCGMNVRTLEVTHPEIYNKGPTQEMQAKYDAEISKYGGLLPWTGIWPGVMECQEFGWYSKMRPGLAGWWVCDIDDPQGTEDLNRLYTEAVWSRKKGRFIRLMTKERLEELKGICQNESLGMGDLTDIDYYFDEIPDSELRDVRENAMASDKLEELEIFLEKHHASKRQRAAKNVQRAAHSIVG